MLKLSLQHTRAERLSRFGVGAAHIQRFMAGLSAQLVAHLPGHRPGPGPSRFVAVFAVRFEQQESANFSALCAETEMPGATTLRSELRAGEALMSWVSMFVIDPQTTRDQAPAQLWRV
jgi:hypothetical protein